MAPEADPRSTRRLSYTLLAGIALSLLGIGITVYVKPPRSNLILDFLGALLLTLVAVEAAVLLRLRGLRQPTPDATPAHHEDHVIHLRCSRCKTQFERVDPGTRPLEAECPSCGLKVLLGVKRGATHTGASFRPVHKAVCLHCGESSYVLDRPAPGEAAQPCPHCGSPLPG